MIMPRNYKKKRIYLHNKCGAPYCMSQSCKGCKLIKLNITIMWFSLKRNCYRCIEIPTPKLFQNILAVIFHENDYKKS